MTLYRLFVLIHAATGALGLLTFWVPALGKKGTRLHKRAGRIYTAAMGATLVLAIILVAIMLVAPTYAHPESPPAQTQHFAAFLAILPILTFSGLWRGIGALRGFASDVVSKITLVLLALGGLLELGLSLLWSSPLHGIFGGLAVFTAFTFRRRQGSGRRERIAVHLSGMLATGVAAHTAFLVFGAPRLIPVLGSGWLGVSVWILPSIIGTTAIAVASRRYLTPVRA